MAAPVGYVALLRHNRASRRLEKSIGEMLVVSLQFCAAKPPNPAKGVA